MPLDVEVLSPKRPLSHVTASSVMACGENGYFTVLENHAPLIAALRAGNFSITKTDNEVISFFVLGGYLEVRENKVRVLASGAEMPNEIDRALAQTQLDTASQEVKKASSEEAVDRALETVHESRARLDFLSKPNTKTTH